MYTTPFPNYCNEVEEGRFALLSCASFFVFLGVGCRYPPPYLSHSQRLVFVANIPSLSLAHRVSCFWGQGVDTPPLSLVSCFSQITCLVCRSPRVDNWRANTQPRRGGNDGWLDFTGSWGGWMMDDGWIAAVQPGLNVTREADNREWSRSKRGCRLKRPHFEWNSGLN